MSRDFEYEPREMPPDWELAKYYDRVGEEGIKPVDRLIALEGLVGREFDMPEGAVSVYLQDFSRSIDNLFQSDLPPSEKEAVEQDMYNVAPLYLLWGTIRDLKAAKPADARAWLDRAVRGALDDVEDHNDASCVMEAPDDMNGCMMSCLCPKRTSVNVLTRQARQDAPATFWESQVVGAKEEMIRNELATLIRAGLITPEFAGHLMNERADRRIILPKEESSD